MLITRAEMEKNPQLVSNLKSWCGNLNAATKQVGCPLFEIGGPETLLARARRTGPAVSHAFMGGEKFRLSSLVVDRKPNADEVTVSCVFIPADSTAAEVSSLTLLLSKAVDVFDGFEAWIDISSVTPKAPPPPGAREEPLPTVEETRASETWGAW